MSDTLTPNLTVVMPVYNDWESAERLVADLGPALEGLPHRIEVVMVDDGSTQEPPAALPAPAGIASVTTLRLAANVGHQRAIAVGLMDLNQHGAPELVAVMDSDGEDRPVELRRMIDTALAEPGRAIVAQRAKRSEGPLFRTFYWFYVRLFRVLTGQPIQFGNFSVLRGAQLTRVVNNQHIWNNFAATLIQARLPIHYVPTARGKRYAGQSRMNFVSLIAHGLGAISVFSEAVFIRILLANAALLALAVAMALGALGIRLFTDYGLPNWATTVLGFALVIAIQAMMMPILMAFMLLGARSSVQPLPSVTALGLIAGRVVLWDNAKEMA